MGFLHGAADVIRECRRAERDFWFIDHAYFNRGYENGNFRVVKNGIHKMHISGRAMFHVEHRPWRSGGTKIAVIPPSATIAYTYDAKDWLAKTLEAVTAVDLVPIIKTKELGHWTSSLNEIHSMASFASVAEVEAAVLGVPVFVSEHSPCNPIGGMDYTVAQRPDRQAWLASLTCSQFHISEMVSGVAWRVLNGDYDIRATDRGGRQLAQS